MPKCPDFDIGAVQPTEVEKVLSKLDTKKATGWDEIPLKVLHMTRSVICTPVAFLFNMMVSLSCFPSDCKKADVCPVIKKGEAMIKKKYRLVSVLSSISKVFEKLMAMQYQFFEKCVLHPYISAFRANYSCNNVLMVLTEKWRQALDKKQVVGHHDNGLVESF